MDPDSFLDLLCDPELHELGDWYNNCSSSSSSSTMDTPAHDDAAQADPDSFLNSLCPELHELGDWYKPSSPRSSSSTMDTPAHDDAAQAMMNHPFLSSPAALDLEYSHAQDAPYRSVIKLSDIASVLLQGFSPAKPINASLMQNSSGQTCSISSLPSPGPLVLSKDGHALMPTGTFKRSSGETNLVDDHAENKMKMTNPSTIYLAPASSSPSALPPAPSPSTLASLRLLADQKRPRKRMKASSLGATSTVSRDTNPSDREGMSRREVHVYSERQRRKRMRESFSILQSLVPRLKLKHPNRIMVLTEVVKYIQSLHVTLEELERKRSDIMSLLGISKESAMGPSPYWWISIYYNKATCGDIDLQVKVAVCVSGPRVLITLKSPKCKGVWSIVLLLLHKYNVEVVNSTLVTSEDNIFQCIHGKVDSSLPIESMDLQDKLQRVVLKKLSEEHKEI